jgi:hypothetical protein
MRFKDNFKTALCKVLSVLTQADGIVNQGEINYIKQVHNLLGITSSNAKKAETISLSNAIETLSKIEKMEKYAILMIIQQLSVSDNCLNADESLLITAMILSLNIDLPETATIKTRIVSIPASRFNSQNSVLYIEPDFRKETNESIERDYQSINDLLESKHRELFYLPKVIQNIERKRTIFGDMIEYLEPSLSFAQIESINQNLHRINTAALSKEIFLNYLDMKGFQLSGPAFFFALDSRFSTTYSDYLILEIASSSIPLEILNQFYALDENILKLQPENLNEKEAKALEKFKNKSHETEGKDELRYTGFHKMIIDTLLKYNAGDRISRLFISNNGRIFLKDRNNIEVKMPSLCRAIYILFLLHEEGIHLFDLPDFKDELLKIYKQTSTYHDEKKLDEAVESAVDYVGITLNSNLSRIKKAFTTILGNEALNYCILGEKSKAKKINLDRRLVSFEDANLFM